MFTAGYSVLLGKLLGPHYILQLLKKKADHYFLEESIVFMMITLIFSSNVM